MEIKYNPKNGNSKFCFKPHEANFMAFLMEQVWEERSRNGQAVPEVDENFFKRFARSLSDYDYTVKPEHIGFVVSFLDEIVLAEEAEEWELSDFERFNIHNFLKVVGPIYHEGHTTH